MRREEGRVGGRRREVGRESKREEKKDRRMPCSEKGKGKRREHE